MHTRRRSVDSRGCVFAVAVLAIAAAFARAGPGDPVPASPEERAALEEARRHVEGGGAADASLGDDVLLLGHASMNATRLHVAAERGWGAVVRYLLDRGADPLRSAPTKSHYNDVRPVDLAVLGGHLHVFRMLKEAGLPPVGEARTLEIALWNDESLPLVSLEEGRWWSVTENDAGKTTTADLLLEPGDPQVSGLGTAAMEEVFRHVLDPVAVAHVPAGADATGTQPPAGIDWRPTLTHRELVVGRPFLVRTSTGAVFRARLDGVEDGGKRCVLHYVRLGASPSPFRASDEPTPPAAGGDALLLAVHAGDVEAVRRLLAGGMDPVQVVGAGGRGPLHLAAQRGHVAIAELLVEAVLPAGSGTLDFDRFLDAHERLLDAPDALGLTPLHVAAAEGQAAVVRALLAAGADVQATDRGERTALHWAAVAGSGETAQALLEGGVYLHAQDAAGDTAAALTKDGALARYLTAMARQRPDVEAPAVRTVLAGLLRALRLGDRSALAAMTAPEARAALPPTMQPLPFEAEAPVLRVGPRRAHARLVLVLPRAAPIGDALRLDVDLAKDGGMGDWRIAGLEVEGFDREVAR